MQLSRNIAWLFLHPIRVCFPCLLECGNVFLRNLEHIDKYDWRDLSSELLKDRNLFVEWLELKHGASPSGVKSLRAAAGLGYAA